MEGIRHTEATPGKESMVLPDDVTIHRISYHLQSCDESTISGQDLLLSTGMDGLACESEAQRDREVGKMERSESNPTM